MSGPGPGEKTVVQKMRENLTYLRANGASRERINEEIARARAALSGESARERALSPAETIAATGSKMASGATFGTFDELSGLWGDKETQRFLQHQLEEESPALAFGAELTGALAVPIPLVGAAPRAASRAVKVGRTLAEGAVQGALTGAGNAEGGPEERAKGAVVGAGAGAAVGGTLGAAVRGSAALGRTVAERAGLAAPKLEHIADKVPDADLTSARARLAALADRNLAHETTVADVLPQGEGALRQAATSNRTVRKEVDAELRSRSNRLAHEADDRLSDYTGTERQSVKKSLGDLTTEAQQKSKPHYDAAEGEAVAFDELPRAQTREVRKQLATATELPYVRQHINFLKGDPILEFKASKDDEHFLLDQVYKDIGDRIRGLGEKESKSGLSDLDRLMRRDLIRQREILGDAMTARAPSYRAALDAYAGPAVSARAFERGHRAATQTPADMIPTELSRLEPSEQSFFRKGAAEGIRSKDTPNLDLGEFARFSDVLQPIATREKYERFLALFGRDKYDAYVKDLLAMAGLQRMKAGAGESTTADKILEQLHSDPEAIVGIVRAIATGNPLAGLTQISRVGKVIDRLRNSKSAQQNADFLLQCGGDKVKSALDHIEQLRAAGKLPRRPTMLQMRGRDGGYDGRLEDLGSRMAAAVVARQVAKKDD